MCPYNTIEKRRAHRKAYYKAHRDECLAYLKKYREIHRDELLEDKKRYYRLHRDEHLARMKNYYLINIDKIRAHNSIYMKKYYKTEKGKKTRQEGKKKYYKTEKGKMNSIKQYNRRKRELGFNPISLSHPNCVWHHVNKNDVVACPIQIHKLPHSIRGGTAPKIEGILG